MQFPAYIVALSVLVSTVYGHGGCENGSNGSSSGNSKENIEVKVFAPKFVCDGKQFFTNNEKSNALAVAREICQKQICNAGCSGSKGCPKSEARNRNSAQAGSNNMLRPSEIQSELLFQEPLPSKCKGSRKECNAHMVEARLNGRQGQRLQ
ncbi:hypothetical protein GcC1_04080 [Golovinomyces cichoracearum]|uniref:Secreted effector protein n=1 Tax=Golovinomyces cichoracearum TaxID=62708 RepID=A0A420IR57_9PEZI|nr:hypothetical protein GcC1_04080 [Golovinomyces cichoracearum]